MFCVLWRTVWREALLWFMTFWLSLKVLMSIRDKIFYFKLMSLIICLVYCLVCFISLSTMVTLSSNLSYLCFANSLTQAFIVFVMFYVSVLIKTCLTGILNYVVHFWMFLYLLCLNLFCIKVNFNPIHVTLWITLKY